MIRYLAGEGDANLSDTHYNKRDILTQITTVSKNIEEYLDRDLLSGSKTEYFDVGYNQLMYYVKSPLISAVTSVHEDFSGLFDGSESEITNEDYIINKDNNGVRLLQSIEYIADKALKIVYTGGLASHCARSTFVLSALTGSGTIVGSYLIGGTSLAVGKIISYLSTSYVVEVLYGIFETGESIVVNASEDGSTSNLYTGSIVSKSSTALCESYPDIVAAAEIEIRFRKKHKHDYENSSTNKESTSRSVPVLYSANCGLQPETIGLLRPYKRYLS